MEKDSQKHFYVSCPASYLVDSVGISRNTLYKILKEESRVITDMVIRLVKVLRRDFSLTFSLKTIFFVYDYYNGVKANDVF